MPGPSPFTAFLAENYPTFKSQATHVGRREAKLGLSNDFWALAAEEKERLARIAEDKGSEDILADALKDIDAVGGEGEDLIEELLGTSSVVVGIVVRTDYSNDEAWGGFVDTLKEAEKDLAAPEDVDAMAEDVPRSDEPSASATQNEVEEGSASESESESEDDATGAGSTSTNPVSLFALASPPASSPLRAHLSGASNLTALRLFNDVDTVRAPVPPTGTRRVKPGHRLVDLDGFVEAYVGPMLWVYDAQSNTDRAARVVNQRVESYGAATADSWRARASFLPELQLNLASGAMKIDFGGLDRWDHSQRLRNLAEANSTDAS
ncbi:hypothetical protein M0805_006158 [Coniferiporia weirii]|nr:hypothetical protein M0805_006158 [Coniferiporia weirii]